MGASLVATYFEMIPMDALFWMVLGIVSTMAPRWHEHARPGVVAPADEAIDA
jgi:hypothetical protein